MKLVQFFLFPPFRLDIANERLWRGTHKISLRPKTFAVLRYLVEHPGQLVNKADLFKAVWPNTYVSEAIPKLYIREIRKVLGDDPNRPRFIETIARRGWRFIAPVTTKPVSSSQYPVVSRKTAASGPQLATDHWQLTTPLVGRETELAQLYGWLEQALQGKRQLIFVSGEPGIGKTTLVETFLEHLVTEERDLWIARGQCVEQYGVGEAYMPVLEALEQLCHTAGGERLVGLLRRHAPMWLVQMPSLIEPAEREELQRQLLGSSQQRMLREIAQTVEALAAEEPLVLVLEDLHWSDPSTVGLIALLARRREQARLLVIGTYRPAEILAREHPLVGIKQELQVHGLCEEIALEFLSEENVAEYLAARFMPGTHGCVPLQQLARLIHQRTEGNPLFMVNVVDYLVKQELIVQHDQQWELKNAEKVVETPTSLRQFIEQQIDRGSLEEQRTLETASVAGMDFSVAAVAAGLEEEVDEVEQRYEGLVRRAQFLRPTGSTEWPDGTVSSCYSFVHALYQEVLYGRVTARRRVQLHRKIGERKEAGYRERAGEIAAELAVHFEEGREYERAIQHLRQAGENANHRHAYQEAIGHLNKGLGLLKTLPKTAKRAQQELDFQAALGSALMATKGFAAPEVEKAYARARKLCQQVGETPQLFPVLLGLRLFYNVRGKLQVACALGEQCLRLAQGVQNPVLLLGAHHALGDTVYLLGELARARTHQERAIALYDPQQHHSLAFLWQCYDLGVDAFAHAAWVLWYLGYPEQALQRSQQAITLARELDHPYSLAHALFCAAWLHQHRREGQVVRERAEAAIALALKHGFAMELAWATILQGWALAEQGQGEEGIVQMCQGLDAWRATGAGVIPYFLALLAEAYGKMKQVEKGLHVLDEVIASIPKAEKSFSGAELYRLKGTLTLQSQTGQRQVMGGSKTSQDKSADASPEYPIPSTQAEAEAEACFLRAMEIARHQQAKSLELRVVMSLARLWQQQGRKAEARQRLAEIYGWFTEGFDTVDLKEARALVEELA